MSRAKVTFEADSGVQFWFYKGVWPKLGIHWAEKNVKSLCKFLFFSFGVIYKSVDKPLSNKMCY